MRRVSLTLITLTTLALPVLAQAQTPLRLRVQERLEQRQAKSASSAPRVAAAATAVPSLPNLPGFGNSSFNDLWNRLRSSASSSVATQPSSSSSSSRSSVASSSSSATTTPTSNFAQRVLDLVNQERSKQGLPGLSNNTLLARAASKYVKVMSDNNHFSHTGPDGRSPTDRIRAEGYPDVPNCNCRREFFYGENIAVGQTSPEQVMKDWMNSAGHKANILSRNFREIGIAVFSAPGKSPYWAQEFGGVWDR